MKNTFEIIVSNPIGFSTIQHALREICSLFEIVASIEKLDDSVENLGIVEIGESEDPLWSLVTLHLPDGFGEFLELKLAESLYKSVGCDVICSDTSVVSGLDAADPYWAIVLKCGQWYFASTVDTKLMNSESDGQIKYIAKLNLDSPARGMFEYSKMKDLDLSLSSR